MSHRVLICGDRDWTDEATIASVIRTLRDLWGDDLTIVHGAARGADSIASAIAKRLGIDQDAHPARWKTYGRAAGPVRNREMLASGVDEVWAFHPNLERSKGTKNMVSLARQAHVPTTIVTGHSARPTRKRD